MHKLRTVGPANRAYLTQSGSGSVKLFFRGLHYGVDDYVPNSLVGPRSIRADATAGEFVCRQMLRDFGAREEDWPLLVKVFLATREIYRHARRSAR